MSRPRFELDTPSLPRACVVSAYNFREVAPEMLSPLAWSLVGAGMEQGLRSIAASLGAPCVSEAPRFVAYFAFRPFHVIGSVGALLRRLPLVDESDWWPLLLGGPAPQLGTPLPTSTWRRIRAAGAGPMALWRLPGLIDEVTVSVARAEEAVLRCLDAPNERAWGGAWAAACVATRQAFAAHMATTGQMVVAGSMLRQALRPEDDESFLLLLSLIGLRRAEKATVPVSGRLPIEPERFATYEVADRSPSFGTSIVRWRDAQVNVAQRRTQHVDPPRLSGVAERLARLLTLAIEDRERTKALGLRGLSCARLLLAVLKSVDPDDSAFLGAGELVRLTPDEVAVVSSRRRTELELAASLDVPIDFAYADGPFRPLRRPPNRLAITGDGRGLAPGLAVAELASAAESYADKILFGRSVEAPDVVYGRPAGVIVEYGSVLSHVAIVCREVGIPLVAGLQVDPSASSRRVRINGWTGTVTLETDGA